MADPNAIYVTGHDGAEFTFPTGTRQDLIEGMLSDHYGLNRQNSVGDPHTAAVQSSYDSLPWYGKVGQAADDVVRLMANGATFGYADKLAGWANGTGSNTERQLSEDASTRAGYAAIPAELIGGVVSGGGLAKAGLTAGRFASQAPGVFGAGTRTAAMAADGAGFGALSATGNDTDIGTGALFGGALGGAIPLAGKAIGAMGGNQVLSALMPESAAAAKLSEVYRRAGMSPEQVAAALEQAGADGQGVFMAADALGNAGQRALAGVARQPTDARQALTEALLGRQMDQGRRVGNALQDASGTGLTAAQYQEALTAQRAADAAKNYAPVSVDPSAIDVSAPVALANRSISPAADAFASGSAGRFIPEAPANQWGGYGALANAPKGGGGSYEPFVPTDLAARAPIEVAERQIRDPIRQAMTEARSYLASDGLTVTNVNQAFRAKTNIDQMIADATAKGQGAKVAELMPMRNALDDALARTSKDYAAARDAYAAQSRQIEAVDSGRAAAAGRQRPEDTIAGFIAQPSAEDAAFRAGYFDPKIAAALTTRGTMSNAARPLVSPAQSAEFQAFAAPGEAGRLQQRIGREMTMHDTMTQAMGGSRTADNLADAADVHSFDPGILADLAHGHFGRAAIGVLHGVGDYAAGQTGGVADRLTRALMQTDPAAVRQGVAGTLNSAAKSDASRTNLVRALSALGGSHAASFEKSERRRLWGN